MRYRQHFCYPRTFSDNNERPGRIKKQCSLGTARSVAFLKSRRDRTSATNCSPEERETSHEYRRIKPSVAGSWTVKRQTSNKKTEIRTSFFYGGVEDDFA